MNLCWYVGLLRESWRVGCERRARPPKWKHIFQTFLDCFKLALWVASGQLFLPSPAVPSIFPRQKKTGASSDSWEMRSDDFSKSPEFCYWHLTLQSHKIANMFIKCFIKVLKIQTKEFWISFRLDVCSKTRPAVHGSKSPGLKSRGYESPAWVLRDLLYVPCVVG